MIESAHPDPDLLAAFAAGATTKRERRELLIHLAECWTCRECLQLMGGTLTATNGTGPTSWRRYTRWVAAAVITCAISMTVWQLLHSKLLNEKNPPLAEYRVRKSRYNFQHVSLATLRPPVPPRFRWVSVLPLDFEPQANQIVVNSQNRERWITLSQPRSAFDTSGMEPGGTAN